MAAKKETFTLCIISILLVLNLTIPSIMASPQVIKGGYFASWATLPSSSIDTKYFTHIYYAFLTPNNNTFTFNIQQSEAPLLINFTSTLHSKTPAVKTIFSVGGAAEGSALFSRMASTPSSRMNFISSSIETARKFNFDGIDLDWEFPQTPLDMENLGHLLNEWRQHVQQESAATGRPPLLLTAAVYYSADTFLSGEQRAYPSTSITKNLDWINVMNYDYRGSWDTSATGAQSALFDRNTNISTSYGLGSWIRAGVPRSKLILGLPLYGRTWQLQNRANHGVGAAAIDVGPGPERSGVLTYAEILEFNKVNKAQTFCDLETVTAYSVAGDIWVGYDDVETVTVKVGYARGLGLRGHFFWALHGDHKWQISKTASRLWTH